MESKSFQDEFFILKVSDWQTADKFITCFTKSNGKVSAISYGAKYLKSTSGGRLLQPFSHLKGQFFKGRKFDNLKSCEIVKRPETVIDLKILAYSSLVAEVVQNLTEYHEAQEEIFDLLIIAFNAMHKRNPRIVAVSTICKLLAFTGFSPRIDNCTTCGKSITDIDKGYFSVVQGGSLCEDCSGGTEMDFSLGKRELMKTLLLLDLEELPKFNVLGSDLIGIEKILNRFMYFQTDRDLKSLDFLKQIR